MTETRQTTADDESQLDKNYSLRSFWRPRYWPVWLLWVWIALIARLPFSWQIKIGKRLGRALMPVLARQRIAAERNLAICFPELDAHLRGAPERNGVTVYDLEHRVFRRRRLD